MLTFELPRCHIFQETSYVEPCGWYLVRTESSGAHAFRRFLRQFWTLHRIFLGHVLTSVKNYIHYFKSYTIWHVIKFQNSCNGFIEGRHICNLLHVKWSNFCNSALNFTKFLPMLGHDWEMSCANENRFRIDGEIVKKHALQINLS